MTYEDGMRDKPASRPVLSSARDGLAHRWRLVLLSLLILFQLVVNWAWLSTNVTVIGWDRPRHLIESLVYNDIFKQIDLGSLFEGWTHSGYYPPLFHFSMVAFYKLFGISMDVAAMVNTAYLVVLLISAYGIGREIGGKGVGLLSAFVASTMPMVFAMSRYTYIEFSLTAMVALGIWLLLLSQEFAHKRYSLLFGLSLGLGFLSKWTFSLFVLPSLIVVILRAGLLSGLRGKISSFSLDKRWLAVSVALGLILTLVWYLPNTQRVTELPLSHLLMPTSWFLFSGLIYLLRQPSHRVVNLMSALWLGLVVAGSWYLSRIDFIDHTFLIAWGRPERQDWAFDYYLDHLINEHLSLLYMVLLILVSIGLLIPAWRAFRQRERWQQIWRSNFLLLILYIVLPYLVFSFRPSSKHSRFIMPILPALAVVMAYGLSKVRFSKLKIVVIALVVLVGTGQLLALSFDGLGWLREAAATGPINLFAHRFQNQLPSSGETDSRYWVVPGILSYIADHVEGDNEALELGLLVNTRQVHDEHFLYLIYTDFPEVKLRELAQNWTGRSAYPQLFEVDYVALPSDNPPHRIDAESLEVVQMLLEEPPVLFQEAFQLVKEYPLPDGNIIYLYEKRYPLPEGYEPEQYQALAKDIAAYLGEEDALFLHPSPQVALLGRYYLGTPSLHIGPEQLSDEGSLTQTLEEISARHERIVTVFEAGEGEEIQSLVGRWLSENCFPAHDGWYGPAHLTLYATPQGMEAGVVDHGIQAHFGEEISLVGYSVVPEEATAGQVLRLNLLWQADAEVGEDYKVFVHLLNGEGHLISQRDREPVGGWRPTTGWQAGELISDHHGLLIPEDVLDGEYELVVGMYELEGDRLPVLDDAGQVIGDKVLLGVVRIGDF
jgi:4-amino-4-deoxy-L-arabinose transferase-like glycosyltransferase